MCDRSMVYRSHRAPFELTRPAVRCGSVRWVGFEGRNTADVGFDPNRPYNAKPFDYALVVVCLAAAIGLLGWAFFG